MNRRKFLYTSCILTTVFAIPHFTLSGCAKNVDFSGLKIGYLPITDHLLIISKELENSDFVPVKFASWADLSEALRSKSIDGAFILTPLALKLKTQGLGLRALLAAHRNGSALVLKKGLINENRDPSILKDKKIAIPSRFSTHYLLLSHLLESAKLTPQDLNIIDMAPTEMLQALSVGSIDGFIVAEPFCFVAEAKEIADLFILSRDIVDNHICCVLAIRDEILQNRAKNVESLVKDMLNTAHKIAQNPKAASEVSTKFLGQNANYIESLLAQDKRVTYDNLELKSADINSVLEDVIKYQVDNFNLDFDSFVDSSFLKRALSE